MKRIEYRQLLFLLIGIYIIFFGYICYLKFDSFAYNDFDLAIDTQTLWNITHGSIYSSIHRIPFLGNHMRLILFLIAPFYAIFPSALTLLFLQTLALGLGAWGIYLITRRIINEFVALSFAFLYLIYPALGYLNLYEFHPTALATCFLIFMFYSYQKEKFKWFMIFLLLALSCQENIPLVLIFFAIYAAIQKRSKRWVFIPFIIGIIYFYLAIFILMPFFGKNTIQFFRLYSHLGNSFMEIIKNIILHPIAVFRFMFTNEKLLYLRALFGPLSFLSLLSPLNLIPSIPLFMQHLLSLNRAETTIYYHYQAELIPFVFISAIYGFRRLLTFRIVKNNYKFFQIIILFFAVVYVYTLGPYPWLLKNYSMYKKNNLDLQKEKLISLIPKEASVLATFEFQPKLANRKELYSFHHVYTGLYTLSKKKYDIPESIDYILMDANDFLTFNSFYKVGNDRNIRSFIDEDSYGVFRKIDNLVLLKRNYDSKEKLYQIYKISPLKISKKDYILDVDDKISLVSLKTKQIDDQILKIDFLWRCIEQINSDLGIILYFTNEDGSLILRNFHSICYRVYPTSSWQKGEIIQEEFFALIPTDEFKNLIKIEVVDLGSRLLVTSKAFLK